MAYPGGLSPLHVFTGMLILDFSRVANLLLREEGGNGSPNIPVASNRAIVLVMVPDVEGNPIGKVLLAGWGHVQLQGGKVQGFLPGLQGGLRIVFSQLETFSFPFAGGQIPETNIPEGRPVPFDQVGHGEISCTWWHISQAVYQFLKHSNSVENIEEGPSSSLPLHHRAIYLSINQRFSQLCHMAATWLGSVMRSFQAKTTQFRPLTQPENGATGSNH